MVEFDGFVQFAFEMVSEANRRLNRGTLRSERKSQLVVFESFIVSPESKKQEREKRDERD
jgi:hypothetical protein